MRNATMNASIVVAGAEQGEHRPDRGRARGSGWPASRRRPRLAERASRALGARASRRASCCTSSLTVLPSTFWPASLAIAAFITRPMSFGDAAPVSAMASATARSSAAGSAGGRQVRLEDRDLRGFLVHEILPAALRELLDGIAALLDERADDLARFRVVERAGLLDLAVHQRGLEHAQRAQSRRVLLPHRVGDGRAHLVDERHYGSCGGARERSGRDLLLLRRRNDHAGHRDADRRLACRGTRAEPAARGLLRRGIDVEHRRPCSA